MNRIARLATTAIKAQQKSLGSLVWVVLHYKIALDYLLAAQVRKQINGLCLIREAKPSTDRGESLLN